MGVYFQISLTIRLKRLRPPQGHQRLAEINWYKATNSFSQGSSKSSYKCCAKGFSNVLKGNNYIRETTMKVSDRSIWFELQLVEWRWNVCALRMKFTWLQWTLFNYHLALFLYLRLRTFCRRGSREAKKRFSLCIPVFLSWYVTHNVVHISECSEVAIQVSQASCALLWSKVSTERQLI